MAKPRKQALKILAGSSPTPARPTSDRLQRLLAAIYDQYQKLDDPARNERARADFVFHMSDWMTDLEKLADTLRQPVKVDAEAAGATVFGFLIHAVPHLMAASKLLLDKVPDTFGATRSS